MSLVGIRNRAPIIQIVTNSPTPGVPKYRLTSFPDFYFYFKSSLKSPQHPPPFASPRIPLSSLPFSGSFQLPSLTFFILYLFLTHSCRQSVESDCFSSLSKQPLSLFAAASRLILSPCSTFPLGSLFCMPY